MRCSNPNCPSRRGEEEPVFLIQISVDSDRTPLYPLEKQDLREFHCLICDEIPEEGEP